MLILPDFNLTIDKIMSAAVAPQSLIVKNIY